MWMEQAAGRVEKNIHTHCVTQPTALPEKRQRHPLLIRLLQNHATQLQCSNERCLDSTGDSMHASESSLTGLIADLLKRLEKKRESDPKVPTVRYSRLWNWKTVQDTNFRSVCAYFCRVYPVDFSRSRSRRVGCRCESEAGRVGKLCGSV